MSSRKPNGARGKKPTTPEESPPVTIVIPTHNAASILRQCLENLKGKTLPNTRILVVDDTSTDQTPEVVKAFPDVRYTRTPMNLGFAGACNHGLNLTTTDYIAFLNDDAFPATHWAETLAQELETEPQTAMICSKILRKDTQIIDSAGGIIEYPLGDAPPRGYLEPDRGQYETPCEVAYPAGAAMVARTRILKEFGGFDQDYGFYFEETDLAWRLRLAGYRIRYTPEPAVEHVGSYSLGANPARKTLQIARNRLNTNLKNLHAKSIPNWLVCEAIYASLLPAGTLAFSGYWNHTAAYYQALGSFLWHIPSTLRKRGQSQAKRRLSEEEVLRLHRKVPLRMMVKRYLGLTRSHGEHLFAPDVLAAAEK